MKILLVEDDKISMMLLNMLVKKLGHESVCCTTGSQAIDTVDDTFDLVLTDWNLPTLSGLDLIAALHSSSSKSVPVILMSCMHDELLQETAEKAGANGYLRKPITAATLDEKIKALTITREQA